MKYLYGKKSIIEDLLNTIGRSDIPLTEVALISDGETITVDFGKHSLAKSEEEKLNTFLSKLGFNLLRKTAD